MDSVSPQIGTAVEVTTCEALHEGIPCGLPEVARLRLDGARYSAARLCGPHADQALHAGVWVLREGMPVRIGGEV